MAIQRLILGPFFGAVTALDPRAIQVTAAADLRNVTVEDGALRVRYGYRTFENPQGGFSAGGTTGPFSPGSCYGFEYLEGYNSSNALATEYVTFENLGSSVRPYHRNTGSASPAEIKDGVTSLSLDASTWRGFAWKNASYFFNPNDTVGIYQHTILDATSFTPIANPDSPDTALTYAITYGGDSTPYDKLDFGGLSLPGGLACAGSADPSSVYTKLLDDDSLQVGHNNASTNLGDASFEIDLSAITAGVQDWTDNDILAFTLAVGPNDAFIIDPGTISVVLTNNDGTSMVPSYIEVETLSTPDEAVNIYGVRVEFYDKDRSLFDNIAKLRVEYRVTHFSSAASTDILVISPLFIGGVTVLPVDEATAAPSSAVLKFGYSYYQPSTGLESGIAGTVDVPAQRLKGYSPIAKLNPLGVHLQLTVATSAAPGIHTRLYVFDKSGSLAVWRLFGDQAIADLTYDWDITFAEAHRLALAAAYEFKADGIVCATSFKSWAVWGYKGGFQNVRHSRVDVPTSQFSDSDSLDDETRGATFSMADNFGDEPLSMFQAGDSLIMVGSQGVYAQVPQVGQLASPTTMQPSRKLPGSFGCANAFACCRWKDDLGNPAVVVLAKEGEGVYLYRVNQDFNGNQGFQAIELTAPVRNSLRSFLLEGQGYTSFADSGSQIGARVGVDEARDALWVILGKRAMVLRKADVAEGRRHWEFYEFTMTGAIQWISFTPRFRMRWFRSQGQIEESEHNFATNAFIGGALRDGGAAVASVYWTSKVFSGSDRSRVDLVRAMRDTYANTPTLTVSSDRQTGVRVVPSGARGVRFGALQQGLEHQVTIGLSETDDPVRKVELELKGPVGERRLG